MVSFSSTLILFAFAISALSAPVPEPQDAVLSTFTDSAPLASETEPITFGDLTIPSQGGTFNDFAAPIGGSSTNTVAPQLASRFFKSRASLPDHLAYVKRGEIPKFLHDLFGGGGCKRDGNCFEAKGGGKPTPGQAKPGSPHKANTIPADGH